MAERSRKTTIALVVLSILLAGLYLMSGSSKLGGAEQHVKGFAHWGHPDWFRLVIGTIEVVAAILLLIPRFAFFGASALIVVMTGAIYTHLGRATGEGGMAAVAAVLLALLILVTFARRPGAARSREPRAEPRP